MSFYHFQSIFDNKTQKNQKNASRSIEMLLFCINMYFQFKSTSLGYVQTNIDYHMVILIEPIY